MSDQDNLFQTGDSNPEPAPAGEPSDLLKSITNEAGEPKYADVPTALRALAASQQYIPEVHGKLDAKDAEISALREELAKRSSVEDFVQQLQPNDPPPAATPAEMGLDQEAAARLFDERIEAHERARVAQKNVEAVKTAVLEKYGDKAEEVFYGKAQELGLSQSDINSLAGTSPAAVLALFGTRSEDTAADVSVRSSVYVDPEPKETQYILGRNEGKSVLSGSTSDDVKAEKRYTDELVARVHAEGGSIDDLTDPKAYKKFFGKRD